MRRLELFIAFRYLRAKRKGIFAAITTAIGVAGVTVGVAALITTLSVMNGFQADIEKKIIGAQADLTVYGAWSRADLDRTMAKIKGDQAVTAAAPFVLGQAIITYQGRTSGVVVKGIDPEEEFKVNNLDKRLREGNWADLRGSGKEPGLVLGEELARNLGTWVGQDVVLVSPQGMATAMGIIPKMRKFRVAGLVHTGYYEYDSSMGFAELGVAAKFFGVKSGATGVGVRVGSLDQADAAAVRLSRALGPDHPVRTYSQMNETLFAALKLEKTVMFLILALIVLVASLNIASTLILRGVEKTRDMGLLMAMGATPKQIRAIFLAEGAMIGAVGLGLGLALGLALCWVIKTFPIVKLPPDIYYLSQVPVSVQGSDVAAVMILGFLMALLATAYPAWRASKIDPVEAIHYG
ncbi:MAG TPA: ABC transporter permease [Elusimicrobiota bacterium]|nr:ABC transporter permease [Elusimicrobiota bacterium]